MDRLNYYASQKIPFFFVISYDKKKVFVQPLKNLEGIYFQVPHFKNFSHKIVPTPHILKQDPIYFEEYLKAFNRVQTEIKKGNTYLLNLTFPTKIQLDSPLETVFYGVNAKFKLYFQSKFICFSPERFIMIKNNTINTYPMKGTIDANLPNAAELILNDKKEMAEHTMVVDLLRNDLNMVANNVQVKQFRYIEKIVAKERELLQVSSHIQGDLEEDWYSRLGDILDKLLPAGSISGTPKHSTCQIIQNVEQYERGFYTGIFGYFDGKNLDSAVMIRFIEKNDQGYIYKSGGGITIDSDPEREYRELLNKIYLPV